MRLERGEKNCPNESINSVEFKPFSLFSVDAKTISCFFLSFSSENRLTRRNRMRPIDFRPGRIIIQCGTRRCTDTHTRKKMAKGKSRRPYYLHSTFSLITTVRRDAELREKEKVSSASSQYNAHLLRNQAGSNKICKLPHRHLSYGNLHFQTLSELMSYSWSRPSRGHYTEAKNSNLMESAFRSRRFCRH